MPQQTDLLLSELRLLCVSEREPSWTVLALHLSEGGCREPRFRWCPGTGQALSLLREESFDCVIVGPLANDRRTSDSMLAELLDVMGVDGSQVPVLVLSEHVDDEFLLLVSRSSCELLSTASGWECPAVPAWIARTMQRFEREVEHHRICTADVRRTVRERDEAESQLEQQRRILESSGWNEESDNPHDELPQEINRYYQELLRTYIIMGSGNLEQDIRRLAELFALARIGPRSALRLHVERVESMVRGLGSRSSRHVMARADILAMELMIELGECYRRKSSLRGLGDFGVDLLHAETVRSRGHTPRREGAKN